MNFSVKTGMYQVPILQGGRKGKLRFSELSESRAVYDAWMENLWLRTALGREDLCVDLYGSKEHFEGKGYVLTASKLRGAELLESYGREMRPQEWNVLAKVPGETLRLYRLGPTAQKCAPAPKERRADVAYHIRGITYPYKKVILSLFFLETLEKIRKKIFKK